MPPSNPYWLGGSPPPDPSTLGLDSVDGGFTQLLPASPTPIWSARSLRSLTFTTMLSAVATSGTLLADGASIDRHFKANEYEWYIQDSWRVEPNLTLTFGIRHTILQTPWETRGPAGCPHHRHSHLVHAARGRRPEGTDLRARSRLCTQRPVLRQARAIGQSRRTTSRPASPSHTRPSPKTSIRAGAGIYYDHYGQSLVNIFDQNGSFGLSQSGHKSGGHVQHPRHCSTLHRPSHSALQQRNALRPPKPFPSPHPKATSPSPGVSTAS